MRERFTHTAEAGRLTNERLGFDTKTGDPFGMFILTGPRGKRLKVIAASGKYSLRENKDPEWAWDHVSVSLVDCRECPTWEQMCWVKHQFWDDDELVLQFHPPKDDYINFHNYVLHLWKPINVAIPMPPKEMV